MKSPPSAQAWENSVPLRWNAKVGSQETPGVTGKFGLGIRNEAGQRLIEFCQENALVIHNITNIPCIYTVLFGNLLLLFSCWVVHILLWLYELYIAHQAPLSMGSPRQEYWSGLQFPSWGDLPDPGIKPKLSALTGGFVTTESPEKPIYIPKWKEKVSNVFLYHNIKIHL